MKAVQFAHFGGPEVLEVVERRDPHPGPGQVRIAVRAAGVNASDWKKRQGLMDPQLPQTMGYEAAGIVDALGEGVRDAAVGDRVFGFCSEGAAQAELAVLSHYAPMPSSFDFAVAASLPSAIETAARALDQLGVRLGVTLLINGASGNIGSAAVQLAVARGARVIGIAGPSNQETVRSLGAEPVVYGEGLADRVRALGRSVDRALDVAGNGILPELIELTGVDASTGAGATSARDSAAEGGATSGSRAGPLCPAGGRRKCRVAGSPEHVVTVADFAGAKKYGVRFSRGDDGRALYVLGQIGQLVAEGKFRLPTVQTFPLAAVAEAHRVGEAGRGKGKIVLLVEPAV